MVLKLKIQEDFSSLFEVSRKDLVLKSRSQDKKRFSKRLNYQVSNFRGVDLKELFENDYFVFNTPIKDYICTVAFPGVFTQLREVVKSTHGDPMRINLQMVIKALRLAFDATDDVKVNCTCGDWKYRFAYVATVHGYKYGPPEDRPANITNPNDSLGATCKHLSLLLSNKKWLVKAASVVNSFIKAYPDKAAQYLYDPDDLEDTPQDQDDIVPEGEESPSDEESEVLPQGEKTSQEDTSSEESSDEK